MKLKAGVLVVTVVISLVLSVICCLLILLFHFERREQQIDDIKSRLDYNLISATNLLLSDTLGDKDAIDTLDLFGESKDSVIIEQKSWGFFELGGVRSYSMGFKKKRFFFIGNEFPDSLNSCVYLADHNKSISLVGGVKLKGDAYLSKAGINRGYIGNQTYNSDTFVRGNIKISALELPALKSQVLSFLADTRQKNFDEYQTLKFPTADRIHQNFEDSFLVLKRTGPVTLSNCKLSGQILVISDSTIIIEPSANLENIIVIARSIIINERFHGKGQFFATDSLILEKNVTLDFPSLICIQKSRGYNLQNQMMIRNNCKISGFIMAICDKNDYFKTLCQIESNCVIKGLIYNQGYLQLKSDIEGIVATDYFIYRTPSVVYENYLKDVSIDRPSLSSFFLVPAIFNVPTKQNIMVWVQ
jgi:hypothetical protein